MSWTTPHTWIDGEALEEDIMNEQIRDNFNFLKDRPSNTRNINEGANYTTALTNFDDVDPTNLSLTITTEGGDVWVGFTGSISNSTINTYVHFDLEVDGVRFAGDDGIIVEQINPANNVSTIGFIILIDTLAAAAHTFKLQWKVSAGTATMFAGDGTANRDVHGQFWVHEH